LVILDHQLNSAIDEIEAGVNVMLRWKGEKKEGREIRDIQEITSST
jgi:hypothetical protein